MDSLTLYTRPRTRGAIILWMLEELGQTYEARVPAAGELEALNPMAKVPVLRHGSRTVTECAAICTYLADAFPEAGLIPADRADFYRWMFFAAGPLEQAVTNRSLGVEPTAEQSGFVGYGSFERALDTIESAVAGRSFIAGDSFSAADVYVGSQIGWGMLFGTIPERPAFTAYWQGLASRPARARADAREAALA